MLKIGSLQVRLFLDWNTDIPYFRRGSYMQPNQLKGEEEEDLRIKIEVRREGAHPL